MSSVKKTKKDGKGYLIFISDLQYSLKYAIREITVDILAVAVLIAL